MKRKKTLTPREERLKKRRNALLNKNLTPRERRLKRKRKILLDKRAVVMKNRVKSKDSKERIKKRVEYIENS